tara:strand:- start:546388 stop:546693 length:306 start_codon:yes stop_codon:yes gene_type:complete
MLKIISSLAIISALGLVACHEDASSKPVTQDFVVTEAPVFSDKHCFLRIRPVGQPDSPPLLISYPRGSEDGMVYARRYDQCTKYRPGDLIERPVRVRVSTN